MSSAGPRKGWMAAAAVLLLLPLTGVTALLVLVSYPAYPIPLHPLQLAFDLGMLLLVAAIIAAWRLAVLHLGAGRTGLRRAHGAWLVVVGLSAVMGLVAAAIAIGHMLAPDQAPDFVGFALLSPAVLLLPVWILLLLERRSRRPAGA